MSKENQPLSLSSDGEIIPMLSFPEATTPIPNATTALYEKEYDSLCLEVKSQMAKGKLIEKLHILVDSERLKIKKYPIKIHVYDTYVKWFVTTHLNFTMPAPFTLENTRTTPRQEIHVMIGGIESIQQNYIESLILPEEYQSDFNPERKETSVTSVYNYVLLLLRKSHSEAGKKIAGTLSTENGAKKFLSDLTVHDAEKITRELLETHNGSPEEDHTAYTVIKKFTHYILSGKTEVYSQIYTIAQTHDLLERYKNTLLSSEYFQLHFHPEKNNTLVDFPDTSPKDAYITARQKLTAFLIHLDASMPKENHEQQKITQALLSLARAMTKQHLGQRSLETSIDSSLFLEAYKQGSSLIKKYAADEQHMFHLLWEYLSFVGYQNFGPDFESLQKQKQKIDTQQQKKTFFQRIRGK